MGRNDSPDEHDSNLAIRGRITGNKVYFYTGMHFTAVEFFLK